MDNDTNNRSGRERLARLAMAALTVFAIFNGLALSYALFDALGDHPFVVRLILAASGGGAISTFIGLVWKILLRSAEAGDRDWQTATVGGVAATIGICLSAWLLAATVAGDEAVQAHQSAYLDALNQQVTRIEDNGRLDRASAEAAATAAVEVDQMAKAEAANGLVSKIASGRGEWARALEAFAVTLSEAADEMARAQARRADRLELVDKTMIEARLAASGGDDKRFEELAIKAARLVGEADRIVAYSKVNSLGAGMMMDEAGEQITTTKGKLVELAQSAETQWRRGDIPFYRPVSKQVATAEQAGAVPGGWLIGVAFELLPMVLLFGILIRPRDDATQPARPAVRGAGSAPPNPPMDDGYVVTPITRTG